MELLCKTRAKLTNGKQRKSGKDPRRWQLINIFKDNKGKVIIKLHKNETVNQSIVAIKDIVCFEKQTSTNLPLELKNISIKESGVTPYHKPNRKLSTVEKQIRYDYLVKNHFPESVANAIERGYSAKDISNARKKLAIKNPIKKTKKLASKEEAIKFILNNIKK